MLHRVNIRWTKIWTWSICRVLLTDSKYNARWKLDLVPLGPPQIPHRHASDRVFVAMLTGQW